MNNAIQLHRNTAPGTTGGFGRIKPRPAPAVAAARLALAQDPDRDDAMPALAGTTPEHVYRRHARAANAAIVPPGDAGPDDSRPSSVALHARARAHRSRELARIIAAAWRAAGALAGQAIANWRRAGEARATRRMLSGLGDHTLRDLGLHRSEILSLAAEVHGTVASTRVYRGRA